jgi:hypothetical protein
MPAYWNRLITEKAFERLIFQKLPCHFKFPEYIEDSRCKQRGSFHRKGFGPVCRFARRPWGKPRAMRWLLRFISDFRRFAVTTQSQKHLMRSASREL